VIGVLPDGFRFPINDDVWLPLKLKTATLERGEGDTPAIFGRIRDGVSIERAAGEMSLIADRLQTAYPETNQGVGSVVKPAAIDPIETLRYQ